MQIYCVIQTEVIDDFYGTANVEVVDVTFSEIMADEAKANRIAELTQRYLREFEQLKLANPSSNWCAPEQYASNQLFRYQFHYQIIVK